MTRRSPPPPAASSAVVRLGTGRGRWVLVATILASSMAMLDASAVTVALPAIGTELSVGVAGLQWTVDAYLVALAALILLGGSLGDLVGRRRVLVTGAVWFALASALCAVAVDPPMLIAARALQGVGGALLVPGSLAIIEAGFAPRDRGRAIGAWSGLAGVAGATGPVLGGWLVAAVSWRLIFVVNVPIAVVVLVAARHVPESRATVVRRQLDGRGALLASLGLAGVTFALIEGPAGTVPLAAVAAAGAFGVVALVVFVLVERSARRPMMPLGIWRSRQFSATNLVTLAVYGALGSVFFLVTVYLQEALGYSALDAGAALLPVTGIMLVLSPRAGALSQRSGPRLWMTLGPVVIACGLLLMRRIGPGTTYAATVLPALVVFGLGLAATVAPLTSTVMGAVDDRQAGVASGVNNAVARAANLLAVAVLPPLVGITGDAYRHPVRFTAGLHTAVAIAAGLCLCGALVAVVGIRNRPRPGAPTAGDERAGVERAGVAEADATCATPVLRPGRGGEARPG